MTPKKHDTKPEAKQDAKPAAQPQPQTAPPIAKVTETPAHNRQMQTVLKLIDAWKARSIDVSKLEQVQDGKFLLLRLPSFPEIKIGPSGGGDLPEIGSYAKFFDAAVIGDQLLAKKKAREQKKQEAAKPAAPAPAKQPAVKSETPTQKKQRQGAEIEKQLTGATT